DCAAATTLSTLARKPAITRCRVIAFVIRTSLNLDDEDRPPIQPTGFLSRVVVLRILLAVAPRLQARRRNATRDQVVADACRAPLTERQVVFSRADVARVSLDDDVPVRIRLQTRDRVVE